MPELPDPGRRRSNEVQRREDCRPLDRDPTSDAPFFCGLGTLWCTEGHGDLEWQSGEEWRSRECGESDGEGKVCRRICAPGRDYHGGGHWYSDPAIDGSMVRELTARWIVTGAQPTTPSSRTEGSDGRG